MDSTLHIKNRFVYLSRVQRKWWAVKLCSGDEDSPRCHLLLIAFGFYLQIYLPPILPMNREWVDLTGKEWAGDQKGYWREIRREIGVSLMGNHLSIKFGRQADDSCIDRHWGCFLPWGEWRFVRMSWYGLSGEHLQDLWETDSRAVRAAQQSWRDRWVADEWPRVRFLVRDFDGTEIVATTGMEEREWRFGKGLFKWLSWFRKPKVCRSLDISFASEVGADKGSWKGGLMGCGIDMLPGELHEQAFRRFCQQEVRSRYGRPTNLQFIGLAP